MDIIDILNEEKKKQGIKNISLAVNAEISPSYLSDILNKKTNPSYPTLVKLTEALGGTISFIKEESSSYGNRIGEIKKKYLYDIESWSVTDFTDLIEFLENKRKNIALKHKG